MLVESYRFLATNAGRLPIDLGNISEYSEDWIKGMQKAMADIQLFGSLSQIEECVRICEDIGKINPEAPGLYRVNADKLLTDLRMDLRRYLGLEKIKNPEKGVYYFRIMIEKDGERKCY